MAGPFCIGEEELGRRDWVSMGGDGQVGIRRTVRSRERGCDDTWRTPDNSQEIKLEIQV